VFELYLPNFQFMKFLSDFVTKSAYVLHKIILNICLKTFLRSLVCLFN